MNQMKPAPRAFQVAAAIIGNALEWYDFLIFGFLTVVVSKLFFPATSEYGSLLMTTATFGVGFLHATHWWNSHRCACGSHGAEGGASARYRDDHCLHVDDGGGADV